MWSHRSMIYVRLSISSCPSSCCASASAVNYDEKLCFKGGSEASLMQLFVCFLQHWKTQKFAVETFSKQFRKSFWRKPAKKSIFQLFNRAITAKSNLVSGGRCINNRSEMLLQKWKLLVNTTTKWLQWTTRTIELHRWPCSNPPPPSTCWISFTLRAMTSSFGSTRKWVHARLAQRFASLTGTTGIVSEAAFHARFRVKRSQNFLTNSPLDDSLSIRL